MTFTSAFSIQIRVIRAIFWRNLYNLTGVGFLLSLIEPVFHIALIAAWHFATRIQPVFGSSTILFISNGLYPVFVFIQLSSHSHTSVNQNKIGQRFSMETPLDFVIADCVLRLFAYTLIGFVLFGLEAVFITPDAIPSDWGAIAQSMLVLAVLGFGMGAVNAAIAPIFPLWHFIYAPVSRVFMLFSGVLFITDFKPVFLRDILSWNPVLHAVSLFRMGFYPTYPTLVFDPFFMWSCAIGVVVFGLACMEVNRTRISRPA
ncbi:capsular polysaccharide transport system permease protein [Faunimonas pinastri]|uniref:Capsular polysaccharide transport system permease protein n=1 Tax=Faunimonas pinastri TaxID=1855383 RepID=A0A1H9FHD8_9HYPH|nr:ABC transporter permease [Faunimonas pinastri]SEQ37391.1 capsular polysaccharide transport system permease protein [Faunimonas pinastri]